MLFLDFAIVAALVILCAQMARPWDGASAPIVHRQRLSLLGRMRMFGRQALAVVVLVVAGWVLGVITPWALVAALVGIGALLALPVGYTLTTDGIRLGRAPLRRWTEFGGIARQRWGVRLQGVAGNPGMTVWLSGNRDDDDFIYLMRRLVRGAYQGRYQTEDAPEPTSPVMPGAAASAM